MIRVTFKRPPAFHALPGKIGREIRKAMVEEIRAGLEDVLDAIDDTPVYTGRTLVNYRFSVGVKIDEARAPISKPDLPGTTSEMNLGKEPRRAANFAVVLNEFNAVMAAAKTNPFQVFWLTNNTPYFLEVEYGTYKTSEGHSVRTPPGGMVRRAERSLASRFGGGGV